MRRRSGRGGEETGGGRLEAGGVGLGTCPSAVCVAVSVLVNWYMWRLDEAGQERGNARHDVTHLEGEAQALDGLIVCIIGVHIAVFVQYYRAASEKNNVLRIARADDESKLGKRGGGGGGGGGGVWGRH